MPNDRRTFFKQVGAGAAAAAAAVAAGSKLSEQTAEAGDVRSFSAAKFALELDGSFAGWISSFEGGHATSEVVTEKLGPDGVAKKHIAGVKYEDITVTSGTGMSKGFYEWITNTFEHKHTRKDGAIIAADYNFNTMTVLKFKEALISEAGFPALDAASKDAAKMTLKFSPALTEYKHTVGRPMIEEPPSSKEKKWTPSNFRLRIDGLEEACARVAKIEALTIKQTARTNDIGDERDYQKEPGKLEFPNLKVTLPEHNAEQFVAWHEDFVIKGNNSEEDEKTGRLEYLTSDLKTVLFSLDFYNLGIFKCSPEKRSTDDADNKLPAVQAEMYCEQIKFTPPKINLK